MPKENKNKTKDAKSLMDDFIKLKKTENRTEQQEKKFQETLSKMAEENPALLAEIIQSWLKQ